jgi:hypothetical protein
MSANLPSFNPMGPETVKFNGDEILAIVENDELYIPAKRICENLGLDWGSQHRKLISDDLYNYSHMTTVGSDGKDREMGCIPYKKLNAWLFSINPKNVPDENIKNKIIQYREECSQVLYDYWNKKKDYNEWIEIRYDGIESFKDMQDIISDFIDYATSQGSKNSKFYRMNFPKMVKKLVGYDCKRESLDKRKLKQCGMMDEYVLRNIPKLMKKNTPYKEIYKKIKSRAEAIAIDYDFDGVLALEHN